MPRCATNLPGCACNKKLFMSFLSVIVMLFAVFQDALLDKHVAEDTFSDQELQDTGRPIKSLLVRYLLYSSTPPSPCLLYFN